MQLQDRFDSAHTSATGKKEAGMRLTARMGANGFGNEFVKLAKLLVCRKKLGIPIAPSYWRSPYRHALSGELCYTSRTRRALRRFLGPPIEFGPEQHRATGQVPVEKALSAFLKKRGLSRKDRTLVEFIDIVPGLETVEGYGRFLHDVLISNPKMEKAVQKRIRLFDPDKLQVGLHVRLGDFRSALPVGTPWPDGKWNYKIPTEWYDQACSLLQAAFPGRIQFVLATNELSPEIDDLCVKYPVALLTGGTKRDSSDVADMLALASCDALVGSASWFSGWAAVLKPKPWIWYACAHGMPPWARETVSLYVDEPSLPEPFLASVEQKLTSAGKNQ
jgi:hypothetical protein